MSGVYGRKIKMTIFGESHGASIAVSYTHLRAHET